MNDWMSKSLGLFGVIALVGGFASDSALAQEKVIFSGGATSAEVTVIAPRLLIRKLGRDAVGVPTEVVSLTRHVTYADLDLRKPADAQTLEKRVDDMAKVACDQLAALYPMAAPESPDCIREATDGAMRQVHASIDAANAHQ